MSTVTPVGRGRVQLALLFLIFCAPVVLAYLFYFNPDWQPESGTQKGELITPARPLPDWALVNEKGEPAPEALRGKWSLVVLGGASCAKPCADKLFELRQIRILQNQNIGRVQRVYLTAEGSGLAALREQLREVHPDLHFYAAPEAAAFFGAGAGETVYLVDPRGNWLMRYAPSAGYQDILKDVKKLLRLSQIG